MKKISVIVPIYNSSKYLQKCIDSLINQTYKNIEIVLVNDGSTDDSERIIKTYIKNNKNIVYIFKQNGGQASARNIGIEVSTGKYISFVDSDDYVDVHMYEDMLEYLKDDIDILVFGFNEVFNSNIKRNIGYFDYSSNKINNFIISPAGPCNKIFKKSLFINNKIKFLENRIYEDLAIIPSIVCHSNNIKFVNKQPYYYVIHSSSTMRQNSYNEKLLDIFPALEFLKNIFVEENKYNEHLDELEFVYIENLLHGASLRFLDYKEGKSSIIKICEIMKEQFPNWKKNKYYKSQNWKYKLFCNLIYKNKVQLVRFLLGKKV